MTAQMSGQGGGGRQQITGFPGAGTQTAQMDVTYQRADLTQRVLQLGQLRQPISIVQTITSQALVQELPPQQHKRFLFRVQMLSR